MTVGTITKCKCKKQNITLDENIISSPCPSCGRIYKCVYSKQNSTLKLKQQKRIKYFLSSLFNKIK